MFSFKFRKNKYVNKICNKKVIWLLTFKKILCILSSGNECTKSNFKKLIYFL